MKPSREITIFLLLAMGLALLPGPLEAANGVIPSSDFNSCEPVSTDPCDAGPCESGSCDTEPDPGADDCCETGCQHCSLPCCSGTVMITTTIQVLVFALAADGPLAALVTDVAWVETDPLYHPPRV
jgi:hypothetical protein